MTDLEGAGRPSPLDTDTRRWLHDKYERLSAEEGQLAAGRTSYFAAIETVLITGILVSLNYFPTNRPLLLLVVSFLSGLGLVLSSVWVVLLHRTVDAQHLWRQAAMHLERISPPAEGELLAPVTLRSGVEMDVDLLRPYTSHARRFSNNPAISWMDRVSPDLLSEVLPIAFVLIWSSVLLGVWILSALGR